LPAAVVAGHAPDEDINADLSPVELARQLSVMGKAS